MREREKLARFPKKHGIGKIWAKETRNVAKRAVFARLVRGSGDFVEFMAVIPAPRACGKIPSGRVRQSQQRRKSGRAGPSFEMLCRGQPCTKNWNAMPLMSLVTSLVTSPVTCPACSL